MDRGQSDLAEPIAIRPTSETAMYPYYATWIRSHRDLPLRLNQWCSVVRWEFKHPQPFLRTREFLWQEGHTAFATEAEADKEVLEILELYRRVYEELLAVPVVPGKKSENEKFAGGNYTTTVEGFIPTTGRAIQGATSHQLGQNFSKMFEIIVDNENKERSFVWQNSWGLSTRSIGAMVMVHGDNKGLVMPPRVAKTQVVIVPSGIPAKASAEEKQKVYDECAKLHSTLKKAGIKVHSDLRDNYTPGFKFNHWELRGVPIRLEIGPKDIAKGEAKSVRRDTGEKVQLSLANIGETIADLLEVIQKDMFQKAKKERDEHLVRLETWDSFVETLNNKNIILSPWCERVDCEKDVKERSARTDDGAEQDEKAPSMGAKTLCIPFEQPKDGVNENTKCFACGQKAVSYTLWGRRMTPAKGGLTLKFLDSEEGHQLIEAVKSLSEGIKGLEQFFKTAVPGAFEESEHSKKHASKKRPRDPDAPKQPLSSYMIFVRDQRAEYKETNPNDKPLEVTEIGRRWRELDEKIKADYAEQAEALKQKYNEEMKVYKAKQEGTPVVVLPPGDDSDDDEIEEIEEHEDESVDESEDEPVPEPPVKKTKTEKKEKKPEPKVEKKPEPKAEKKVEKKPEPKPTPKLSGKPISESNKGKSTPTKNDVESSPEKRKKKKATKESK
ncbi:ribose-phosphate pyrophosphokinase 1 [Terramyces sp. JEL0728]|nr:ribose-phosphate pyrophosphokinase 1 [Terramyces sp. JEL0728]